jgi:phosphoglycolate phosphatase
MPGTAQPKLPETLLFDLDGTLLDSLPGIRHSAEAAFKACGLKMGEVELRRLIGPPIRTILARMAAKQPDQQDLDELVQAFRWSYDTEGWRMTPHYPGAVELLRAMQAYGRRLFVVSNKPRHIAVRILEAEGTVGFFKEIVTRDSREPAYSGKQEMLDYLLRKWELRPGECLMIGDTTEDALAASAVGIKSCLMTHGYGDVPVGSAIPVAFRIDHFSQLMRVLEQEQRID